VFGIATAGGRRGQGNRDWRVKAALFSLAALGAAAACGAGLGWLGSLIPERGRVVGVSLFAIVFMAAGLAQLRPASRIWLWERDCETAQAWLQLGALRWAIVNGAALGTGFLSRIGVISWYVVPLAAVGFGSPELGAILYGLYGGIRGLAVWLWIAWLRRARSHLGDPVTSVLELGAPGKRLSAALLVALAAATIVVAGA